MSANQLQKNVPILVVSDSTNQAIASATASQLVTFDTVEVTEGIALGSSTNITVPLNGFYNIQLGAEVELTTGNNQTITTWFQVGGVDVAHSASDVLVPNASSKVQLNHCEILELDQGDVLTVRMSGTSTNLRLLATAAGVSPTRPEIPSIHLTVALISRK